MLKDLRFQLNLDDPKLPQDQWVTLRGDRTQLEGLSEAVQTYVQAVLQATPNRLNTLVSTVPTSGIGRSAAVIPTIAANSAGISLQSNGLLTHDLVLGSLARETSTQVVHLSTLQLFDLANALDEYATDVLTLPNLQSRHWFTASPAWTKIAAAALLLVGVSVSIVKVLESPQTASTSPTTSQGASSNDQRTITQLPTATATPSPLASPKPIASPPLSPKPSATNNPAAKPATSPLAGQSAVPGQPIVPGQPTLINPPATENQSQNSSDPTSIVSVDELPRGGTPELAQQPAPSIAANPESPNAPIAPAPAAATRARPDASTAEGRSAASAEATDSKGTAFDTIPQVAEVREFFKQRWTPPQGLTQTVQYQIVVDAKGNVQSISPLGDTAGSYLDRTGIPEIGKRLTSELKSRQNARIRLVLSPDGEVQTFLE